MSLPTCKKEDVSPRSTSPSCVSSTQTSTLPESAVHPQEKLPNPEAKTPSVSTATQKPSSSTDLGEHNPTKSDDAPQLQKWAYQTSNNELTLAENFEKFKWEGECGLESKNGEK